MPRTPGTLGHLADHERWDQFIDDVEAGLIGIGPVGPQGPPGVDGTLSPAGLAAAANAVSAASTATAAQSAAVVAQDLAEDAAVTATSAASQALASQIAAVNASNAADLDATAASNSALLAERWATLMGQPVTGSEYSAKWHATQASEWISTRGAKIAYQPTEPADPEIGEVWIDSDSTVFDITSADILPPQSGQSNKYLRTNGSLPFWDVLDPELPTQTGQAGKFLSTNGTVVSWQGAAPLDSPAFTGTPTAPTPASGGDSSTKIATTQWVQDRGYLTGLAALAWAAPINNAALTGTPTAPTPAVDTNSTHIATTAYVIAQKATVVPLIDGTAAIGSSLKWAAENHVHPTDTSRAPLASPSFTGTVVLPTTTTIGGGTSAGAAWTAYTPTLGGFTAGNGTWAAAYMQIGKTVHFRAVFTFGSTSTAAAASPTITLPVSAIAAGNALELSGSFTDNTNWYDAAVRMSSATVATLSLIGANGIHTALSTTTPFTWAVGHRIIINGTYEAA